MRYLRKNLLALVVLLMAQGSVTAQSLPEGSFFLLGSAGLNPVMSYGGMVGYVNRWGGYATVRSSFQNEDTGWVSENRILDDGTILWTKEGAKTEAGVLHISGGFVCRVDSWMYPYCGVSYGKYDTLWEDYLGRMVLIRDESWSGMGINVGALFKLGPVSLSCGANYYLGKLFEAEVGVGVFF